MEAWDTYLPYDFQWGDSSLQDVEVLWELPIERLPVTGSQLESSKARVDRWVWEAHWYQLAPTQFSWCKVKKESIESLVLRDLTGLETYDECIMRAHNFILLLLEGQLLPNISDNLIPVRYISLLEDINAIYMSNWTSCVLGFLYRCLCEKALGGARQIKVPLCYFRFGHGCVFLYYLPS